MNVLPIEKRTQIINLLVEGNSMRATSRIADCSINTVTKLLIDVGIACSEYQDKAHINKCFPVLSRHSRYPVGPNPTIVALQYHLAYRSTTETVTQHWLQSKVRINRNPASVQIDFRSMVVRLEKLIAFAEQKLGGHARAVPKRFGSPPETKPRVPRPAPVRDPFHQAIPDH